MKLVWLDLETTGLDPKADLILAFGVRVTDERLTVLGELEAELSWSPDAGHRRNRPLDPKVLEMHIGSGLLERCRTSDLNEAAAEIVLRTFLTFHLKGENGTLAGSSVHFDRSFLAERMPSVPGLLSHRHLDVSVFKTLAPVWGLNPMPSAGPPKHTPLADLDHSLEQLRYWTRQLVTTASTVAA